MNRIILTEGFLGKEETASLYKIARNFKGWESRGHHFWDGRVCDVFKAFPEWLGDYITEGIRDIIAINYGDLFQTGVYYDTLDLVKWSVGSNQSPHQDNIPEKNRLVGCVIYINDDFWGGETFYPNLGVSVKPVAGNMALHLGDEEHLHGVTEVSGGDRFTISSFWGTDANMAHYHLKAQVAQR